jgi:hypothetical protein
MIAIIILAVIVIIFSLLCLKQQDKINEYEFFIQWIVNSDIDMKDKLEWINNLKRSFRRK